jgi:hypothetical protein
MPTTPPCTTPPPTTSAPPTVAVYPVDHRPPGTGRILAVFTDSPTDLAVAQHAADLAASTAAPIVAAAVVRGSGFSVNALLHRVRARRIAADTDAVTARVAPILRRANTRLLTTTLLLPASRRLHHPSAAAVHRLARRVDATTVVLAAPPHQPAHDPCKQGPSSCRGRATGPATEDRTAER